MSYLTEEIRAACPYYLRHRAGRIVCRGYAPGSQLALEFNRPGPMRRYYREQCCLPAGGGCPLKRLIEKSRIRNL